MAKYDNIKIGERERKIDRLTFCMISLDLLELDLSAATDFNISDTKSCQIAENQATIISNGIIAVKPSCIIPFLIVSC